MVPDDKYVVLKKGDTHDNLGASGVRCYNEEDILEDAVVIRTQDVFAEAGLRAYAATIDSAREILRMSGLPQVGGVTDAELMEISDYFLDRAAEAGIIRANFNSKVPD